MTYSGTVTAKFNSIETRLVAMLLLLTVLPVIAVGWVAHGLVFENIRTERMNTVGQVAAAKHDQLTMVLTRANNRGELFLAELGNQCRDGAGLNRNCAVKLVGSYLTAEGALGATLRLKGGSLDIGAAVPAQNAAFRPGQLAGFSGSGPGNNQSYFISVTAGGLQLDVSYPSSNLQPIFDRPPELGESGETFFADGDGYFVTRNRYPSTQGQSEPIHAHPMHSCLSGENKEVLDLDYRDAEIIHGYRQIPEFGSGCIMAHIDQAEAFAPLAVLQQKLAVMAAFFFGLVLLVALVMARNIAKPIVGLTKVVRRIASGDHRAQAKVAGNDEISELAGSFNSMTAQLVSANSQLEQKILELGASEERYRKLFEEATDAIAFADAETGEILDLNQAFADMLGWERQELIGKPQKVLRPPEPDAPVSGSFEQHRSVHAGDVIETQAITRDGRILEVAIKAAIMELNGRKVVLGMFRDITARKLAERRLAESYRKLQQLSLYLDNVREDERGRVALELHDEMGATLTALKMSVHWLATKLPAETTKFTEELEHMDKLVSGAIHTMRHVVGQLRPVQLHDLGFAAAVERHVSDFRKSTGIECTMVMPEEEAGLDENQSAAIFRILQESLNNVAKHAHASKVGIVFVRRGHSLLLRVQDNGIGFDPGEQKTTTYGLLGIRERARMVNGRARISSAPGKGTRVVVRVAASSYA